MNIKKQKAKRLLALVLSFCMLIPIAGSLVFAASAESESGLCEHHTEHTQECGYQEGAEGQSCTFVCEICDDKAEPSAVEVQAFSELPQEIKMQEVQAGTSLEEISLPSQLTFTDGNGETATMSGINWQSFPQFNGESSGDYEFSLILPQGYVLQEGVTPPTIRVAVTEGTAEMLNAGNVYEVDNEETLAQALKQIEASDAAAATLVLRADINTASFAGIEGKEITVTSADDCDKEKGYTFSIAKELAGDVTLDHVYVKTSENFAGVFANGHKFETTEQFQGVIYHLYGGGSAHHDVIGSSQIIIRGGMVNWLYGGGLDSNVTGDVQITIDGANADVQNLFGGGRAQDSDQGRVHGNITIDFRQGKTRSAFGGGENRYTEITNKNTEPASVSGTVTFNMGYEGAPEASIWPGTATFSYGGSYHSTVGNVVLNISDGVTTESDAGDRDIYACGYSDTVRGTVRVNVFGSPDILGGYIYAGGNTEAGIEYAQSSVQILNENNDEYAVRITYDVPKELESAPTRHGINLGSKSTIPTTINGNALIELKSGNMDFLVLDNEAANYLTVNGNTEIRIGEGRVAQVQGNKQEYDSKETTYTTTVELSGESEIGYFYRFDEAALIEGAQVLVDATEFTQFNDLQKPFFSVNNLFVGKNASLITQNNDQARIMNSVVLEGTWEQRYCSGKAFEEDADRANADLRIGGSIDIDGGTLISRGTTHVYNNLRADGGTLVFVKPAIISMTDSDKGRVFSVDETKIYLPVIGKGDTFYPAENNLIRLAIGEKATGTADVYLFEGDDYLTSATITDGHIGQNYINAQREQSDAIFTLIAEDGYYFKRVDDSKTAGTTAYDMWQIDKQQKQQWYYEVYYEYIDPDTNVSEWTLCEAGHGGWEFPNKTVTISSESFDGEDLGWEDITGEQNEKLGIHYVYDENYGPHRLSALCEATKDNPLKIYYRAALNDVVYEYEGNVPDGADALLPKTEKKAYYSSVRVADDVKLDGYEFSGWTVKSPDYTEVENGAFFMPNETVTLVGSWTKMEEPLTITLTPQDMIAYTGGDSMSGDTFPSARYKVEVEDGVDLSKVSFEVNGTSNTLPAGTTSGDIVVLPWLDETFTLQESAAMTFSTAINDAVAGEYEIGVDISDVDVSDESGTTMKLEVNPGTLTVRNVSAPQAVITGALDVAKPVVSDPAQVNTEDGIAMALIPENAAFYTNGKAELGLLGKSDTGSAQIALLFDDLLMGEQGEDTKQLLMDRAAAAGHVLSEDNVQFKYLDLINENDGNAWVSTDDGTKITIYWPLPQGVSAEDISVEVLHFKGLHREYRGDIADQVANCEVDVISARIEGNNVVFELEGNQSAGSFSPFAIHWTKQGESTIPQPENKIDVTAEKVWKLDDGGSAVDHVTVMLRQNGKEYDTVELSEQNDWQYTWHGLSDRYLWTVEEVNVPSGFTVTIEQDAHHFTIINDDVAKSSENTDTSKDDDLQTGNTSKDDDLQTDNMSKDHDTQTGSTSNLLLWASLLTLSGTGVIAVSTIRKKRKHRLF